MALKYKISRAGKLNYLFFDSRIDVGKFFNVVRQQKFSCRWGKLNIYIIGESHAVQFKNKHTSLTEVLAYVRKKKTWVSRAKIIPMSLVNDRFCYKYKNTGLHYQIRIKREKTTLKKISRILSDIRDYPGKNLFLTWPVNKRVCQPSAFTSVNYAIKNNVIKIKTYHFYDNELILVTSCSQIKIKNSNNVK